LIRQLTLDLPVRTAFGRDDFFVSPGNATALAALDDWRGWPLGKMLLCGPSGAGKTHLAHVWAAETGATILPATDLAASDIATLATGPVVVEDAEAVAGHPPAEAALFHLHNALAEARHPLLLTSARPPRDWGLKLADLASRMQAASLTRLDPPDDALLTAVLVKLFADRQIAVPPTLIPYLVARMDRSFEAARTLVARLDAEALARGKAVTRQLAAQVLDSD
jgi:chromosomal replication initiation ATPase DnaA